MLEEPRGQLRDSVWQMLSSLELGRDRIQDLQLLVESLVVLDV
jgi:hypothetical protein